eukprot:TRINITY_DN1353_c0_g1_i3.p1 TRINITY_DN1353_c0_g1~~TRINITY_DN1353_c0_g1_i3.p1  ORF type:complete len:193 (+),score=19.25 TRINITY_DN1353_c0_g1_i3:1471-2049(+)
MQSWANALADYIQNPERHKDSIYEHNSDLIVIFDAYPKAKKHLLILPTKLINGFSELDLKDIELITKMKLKAEEIAGKLTAADSSLCFQIGFHAIPSMRQLHLHLISTDFDSPCLKNKKHWNSFTSNFFITVDDFITRLKNDGQIRFDAKTYENLLKQPLLCHRCSQMQKTIPALKKHILTCKKPLPSVKSL